MYMFLGLTSWYLGVHPWGRLILLSILESGLAWYWKAWRVQSHCSEFINRAVLDSFRNSHVISDHTACFSSHYPTLKYGLKKEAPTILHYVLYLCLIMCICAHIRMYMSMWIFLPSEIRGSIISRVEHSELRYSHYSTGNRVFFRRFRIHSFLFQITYKL